MVTFEQKMILIKKAWGLYGDVKPCIGIESLLDDRLFTIENEKIYLWVNTQGNSTRIVKMDL